MKYGNHEETGPAAPAGSGPATARSSRSQRVRPRRSVMYMPGANARALEKAMSLAADGLIFDLEDAVAPAAKPEARGRVCEALRVGGYGARETVVRVNGVATPWGHADLVAAAQSGADAVLVPKVESAETVRQVLSVLDEAGAPDGLALWCMIETPLGVLRAETIAAASPRTACLVMGTSDLARELHAAHTAMRLPMLGALGHCLLAARAYGLAILDGVHLELDDDEGFAAACRQGAELGFDGKTLIHPRQIEAANAAFAPGAEELARAAEIIAAHAEATREGKGVVVVDGQLIEQLHVDQAKRRVELADAIARLAG